MKNLETLKIHVLCDNVAGRWFRAEHGLSFLIEADETLLFDTGSSDLITYNAKILGIDLNKIKTVVLSHGHDDHTGGLALLSDARLICHPDSFLKRFRKSNNSQLGIKWSEAEIRAKFDLLMSTDPVRLSERIWFLGEIPRLNDFESKKTAFRKEDFTDDFVMDDSGLAIETANGLVIVSGCAHSGICNMIAHARRVTGIENIRAVIGGFHLQDNEALTDRTIDWMKTNKVSEVMPCHCTSLQAQAAMLKHYKFRQIKSGNIVDLK